MRVSGTLALPGAVGNWREKQVVNDMGCSKTQCPVPGESCADNWYVQLPDVSGLATGMFGADNWSVQCLMQPGADN